MRTFALRVGDGVRVRKGKVGAGTAFIVESLAHDAHRDAVQVYGRIGRELYGPVWADDLDMVTPAPRVNPLPEPPPQS